MSFKDDNFKFEVSLWKHPKLQTNLKLKKEFYFFHQICIYRIMQIKVICILSSVVSQNCHINCALN